MSEDQNDTGESPSSSAGADPSVEPRRSFLASASALAVGAAAAMVPIATGLAAVLDPLRRQGETSNLVRVTRLSAVPEDGTPRKFTVTADQTDAWTTRADARVGAVYLRRVDGEVRALNVVCPHAGCFVGLADNDSRFACPCHRSSFDLDGTVNDPASPSPRAMDSLDVEVRGDEVWVRFQNFLPGREEKTPV